MEFGLVDLGLRVMLASLPGSGHVCTLTGPFLLRFDAELPVSTRRPKTNKNTSREEKPD